MALEREYKWLVPQSHPTPEALRGLLLNLGAPLGVTLHPRGERQQEDLYHDLPNGDLLAGGVALRVRRFGTQVLATLKLPGRVRGGLHEREELETPLAPTGAAATTGVAWPDAIRERLAALGYTDLSALVPVLQLSTRRYRVLLQDSSTPVAELSFDAVEARWPEVAAAALPPGEQRREPVQFHELELEAQPDTYPDVLDRLAARLEARLRLEPHTQDKVTHALGLLKAAPRRR